MQVTTLGIPFASLLAPRMLEEKVLCELCKVNNIFRKICTFNESGKKLQFVAVLVGGGGVKSANEKLGKIRTGA